MTEKRVKRIIRLKEHAKEEIELEIRRTKAKLNEKDKRLQEIKNSLDNAIGNFHAPLNPSMTSLDLELLYNSIFNLHKEAEAEKEEKKKLEENLDEKRDRIVEVNREKRLLEILIKRMVTERARKASKNEQREIDFDFLSRRLR